MSRQDSTPSRSKPALFNAGLFSSPLPEKSSDMSSLGEFGDNFLSDKITSDSPFSLAPAKPIQSVINTVESKDSAGKTDSQITQASNLFSSIPPSSSAELFDESLSSVSLQTPPHTNVVFSQYDGGIIQQPVVQPVSSDVSHPVNSSLQNAPVNSPIAAAETDFLQLQPLVNQSERLSNPSGSVQGSQPSNPYRIGNSVNFTGHAVPQTQQRTDYSSAPITTSDHLAAHTTNDPVLYDANSQPSASQAHNQSSVTPVVAHWFYLKNGEKYWYPFNILESTKLNEAYIRCQGDATVNPIVQTDGGRYDVDVRNRIRMSVYWKEPPSQVRRCTWFYKGDDDDWYIPYEEAVAQILENTFCYSVMHGQWNTRVDLSNGDGIILHSDTSIVHYTAQHFQPLNYEIDYGTKTVLRGFLERDKVNYGDNRDIDHVIFVVKGLECMSNSQFEERCLVDNVDDFREVSMLMLESHKFSGKMVTDKRVEFLPVNWNDCVEDLKESVDEKLKLITLPSISRLRDFTNSTLSEVFFYASPLHKQIILNRVATEMNEMLETFNRRNPEFSGKTSVMGHGLGSVILFDLLYHQGESSGSHSIAGKASIVEQPISSESNEDSKDDSTTSLDEVLMKLGLESCIETFKREEMDFDSLTLCSIEDLKEIGLPLGPRKKLSGFISSWNQKIEEKEACTGVIHREENKTEYGQDVDSISFLKGSGGVGNPVLTYPVLKFKPAFQFALGSPISLFLAISGIHVLDQEFELPTCSSFYNIFHPYDPMAYRVEPLISNLPSVKPVLMSHHKGRKRFHLELYENLEKVGTSVKHHIMDGVRNMWNQLNELARAHTASSVDDSTRDEEDEASISSLEVPPSISDDFLSACLLNKGKRIDYVLQETPIEKLNDYLFALRSHVSYWRSEDTAYFLLRQLYGS